MSNLIIKEFAFGEANSLFYKFNVHVYQVPGSSNKITTIMLVSTNMMNREKELIDPHLQDLVQFLANLVIEYRASYDAFHNQLHPYSYEESEDIAEQVNAKAAGIYNQ